jgi:predicted flap endonuclease-1-like 5' DNA nuclease
MSSVRAGRFQRARDRLALMQARNAAFGARLKVLTRHLDAEGGEAPDGYDPASEGSDVPTTPAQPSTPIEASSSALIPVNPTAPVETRDSAYPVVVMAPAGSWIRVYRASGGQPLTDANGARQAFVAEVRYLPDPTTTVYGTSVPLSPGVPNWFAVTSTDPLGTESAPVALAAISQVASAAEGSPTSQPGGPATPAAPTPATPAAPAPGGLPNDLARIEGIGPRHAEMLESIGVDTVKELSRRNPTSLKEMIETRHGKVVGLSAAAVTDWVGQAKTLSK